MTQITCNDVSLGYDGKTVVSGLNFKVNQGDYLCIVGENGVGKSTLIKTLLGLKKPYAGQIDMSDDVKTKQIGYLPQQTVVQRDFPASVKEVVLLGCLSQRGFRLYYNKEEKNLAKENMEKLGITHLANRCYRELSGGQQQRVLLARALCAAKKMILLDEPVAGLDPKATTEMYELIQRLNKNEGLTVIMVSHDVHAFSQYATHILHVAKTDSFYGSKDAYMHSEKYLSIGGNNSCKICATP